MKRTRLFLWTLLMLAALLQGCGKKQSSAAPRRVVTGITVSYGSLQKHFTASPKVRAVLNYLRWLDPYGTVAGEPEPDTEDYRITVEFSDGGTTQYRQRGDRYLSVDNGSWQTIDPKKALTLPQILNGMESDLREAS